jgi:hypothetical protein
MGQSASTSSDSPIYFDWMWKSNANPWSDSEPAEWRYYSDVENVIIEDAFSDKQTNALLENHLIDFEHDVQVANNNANNQRPIKRIVRNRNHDRLREERFMPNPFTPKSPFNDKYGWISLFIMEVQKDLQLKDKHMPLQDETTVPMIVKKAALGITEEGKYEGKQREAEWIAKELTKRRKMGLKTVWKCCARLYLLESFLYKKLNEAMRFIGNNEYEHVWRSKIRTFGPFCLLLWSNPFKNAATKREETVYRGANLSDSSIASFTSFSQSLEPQGSFQAFTSTSRNRAKAEQFGNVLFIMHLTDAYTIDYSQFSDYPGEEEVLIYPGTYVIIQHVELDITKNKHLIYLNLAESSRKSNQIFSFVLIVIIYFFIFVLF